MSGQQCPRCGNEDQVQSARNVVSAGSSSGTFSGPTNSIGLGGGGLILMAGSTDLEGSTQTVLAQRVSPPTTPGWRNAWWTLTYMVVAGGVLFGLIALWLTVLLAKGEVASWVAALVFWIIAAGGLAVAVWAMVSNRRRRQRAAGVMPAWHQAMSQWEPLNYCHRCDVVFAPGSSQFETPEAIENSAWRCGRDDRSAGNEVQEVEYEPGVRGGAASGRSERVWHGGRRSGPQHLGRAGVRWRRAFSTGRATPWPTTQTPARPSSLEDSPAL